MVWFLVICIPSWAICLKTLSKKSSEKKMKIDKTPISYSKRIFWKDWLLLPAESIDFWHVWKIYVDGIMETHADTSEHRVNLSFRPDSTGLLQKTEVSASSSHDSRLSCQGWTLTYFEACPVEQVSVIFTCPNWKFTWPQFLSGTSTHWQDFLFLQLLSAWKRVQILLVNSHPTCPVGQVRWEFQLFDRYFQLSRAVGQSLMSNPACGPLGSGDNNSCL